MVLTVIICTACATLIGIAAGWHAHRVTDERRRREWEEQQSIWVQKTAVESWQEHW